MPFRRNRPIASAKAFKPLVGLLFYLTAGFATSASAQECGDPGAAVDGLGRQVIAILQTENVQLEERERQLGELLAANFNLSYIGKITLGPTYRNLDDRQRVEYHELFADYVLKTYSVRLSGYSGQEFIVGSSQPAGKNDFLVASTLRDNAGTNVNIDWRLRCYDRGFRIIDVQIEGVSMVVAQRNDFGATIAQKGFDGLLEILRTRTERPGARSPVPS